jgi:NhaP-type Na+/H+ or K+/H+ antiporter
MSFSKNLFMVILFTFVPSAIEASVAAVLGHFIFGMPWVVAFFLGYTLACAGPAILIPACIRLSN